MFRDWQTSISEEFNTLLNKYDSHITTLTKDMSNDKIENEALVGLYYLMHQANADLRMIVDGHRHARYDDDTHILRLITEDLNTIKTRLEEGVNPFGTLFKELFANRPYSEIPVNVHVKEVTKPSQFTLFETAYKGLCETLPDKVKELKGLSIMLKRSQSDKVRVYQIDDYGFEGHKQIVLLTYGYHYDRVLSFLAMLPSIYADELEKCSPGKAEMDTLVAYCLALGKGELETAYNIIRPFVIKENEEKTKKQIESWAKMLNSKERRTIEANISDAKSQVQRTLNAYMTHLENLQNLKEKLFMIELRDEKSNPFLELFEYINNIKAIEIKATTSTHIELYTKNYLEYVNPEVLEKYKRNSGSFYNGWNEKVRWIIEDAFIHNKIKIPVVSRVIINIERNGIEGMKTAGNTTRLCYDNYLPHPHIAHYNCWGNNEMHIRTALSERNFINAIEQMMVALYNLSLEDTAVTNTFMKYINDYPNAKVLDLETNEEISIREYINKKVKEREEKENETNNTE